MLENIGFSLLALFRHFQSCESKSNLWRFGWFTVWLLLGCFACWHQSWRTVVTELVSTYVVGFFFQRMLIRVSQTLEERAVNLNNSQSSIIWSDGRCFFEIAAWGFCLLLLFPPGRNDRKHLDRFCSLEAPVTFVDSQYLIIFCEG